MLLALVSFFGAFATGCDSDDDDNNITEPTVKDASMTYDIDLSEIMESNDFNITKIKVKIQKGSFADSTQLSVSSGQAKASGSFKNLEAGTYDITVFAYDDAKLVATGSGTAKVVAGKSITAAVALEFINGNLEIVITLPNSGPKYIFFFIGDGMASPQINATEAAIGIGQIPTAQVDFLGHMSMNDFTVAGMATTHAEDRYITGSAAAATALATGYKTSIGTISMNSSHSLDHKTMAEMAKEKGMKIGIVSSVSIDHATPAGFYAHTDSRGNYEDIGNFLVRSGFDYFAGGNVRHNEYDSAPKHASSVNYSSLQDFISHASDSGYTYVNTKAAFDAISSGKVIATIKKLESFTSDGCALPYAIDLGRQASEDDQISLADFTKKGIQLLDNEKGFFMMVEGGKVDWACHANDAVSAIYDMIAFDNALAEAVKFYNEHKDETLIVVTGDHECGGMTLGFAGTKYETAFNVLKHQKLSFLEFSAKVADWATSQPASYSAEPKVTFENALDSVSYYFGLGTNKEAELALSAYDSTRLENAFNYSMTGEKHVIDEEHYLLYGSYDAFTVAITHILNEKAGIAWTSYKHTGVPVPVFALGVSAEKFDGYYDNTDIAKKIIDICDLD